MNMDRNVYARRAKEEYAETMSDLKKAEDSTSPLETAFRDQATSLEILSDQLDLVINRLRPILGYGSQMEKSDASEPKEGREYSELVTRVQETTSSVRYCGAKVMDILDRLEM